MLSSVSFQCEMSCNFTGDSFSIPYFLTSPFTLLLPFSHEQISKMHILSRAAIDCASAHYHSNVYCWWISPVRFFITSLSTQIIAFYTWASLIAHPSAKPGTEVVKKRLQPSFRSWMRETACGPARPPSERISTSPLLTKGEWSCKKTTRTQFSFVNEKKRLRPSPSVLWAPLRFLWSCLL